MKNSNIFTKDFVLLWLGQTVSIIGNSAGNIALMWWITAVEKSVVALGVLGMIKGLIAIATGPFAGALVDRLNRKKIIVLCDFFHFIIYGILGYLALMSKLNLTVVYITGALSTLINVLFAPAIGSALPLIVTRENLVKANSLHSSSSSTVRIIGYAIGGIGISLLGIPMLLIIDSISFLVSALSELFIYIPNISKTSKVPSFKEITKDVVEGFKYIKENKALFSIMKFTMISNVIFIPFSLLLPKFVKDNLGLGSDVYGYIISASMVGALIASLLLSNIDIPNKYPYLIRWCFFLAGLFFIPFSLTPGQFWFIHVFIFFVISFISTIFNINNYSRIQKTSAKEHLGKVLAFKNTMSGGLMPISQGFTGFIAQYISITIIYLTCALVGIIAGIKFAFSSLMISWLVDSDTSDSYSTSGD